MAEIDTPMYDLTVGPPPSSKEELFPRGLQLVTDKSRPIATVARLIMALVLLGKEELGIVMRPRDTNGLGSSNTWKGDSR